jgi:hypothetical protein
MIPAFDAGDKFRDLNIANTAYAREDSYVGDTEPYDCSSCFNAREVQTLGPAFFWFLLVEEGEKGAGA